MATILLLNSAMVHNTTTAEYQFPQNLNHKMSLDLVAVVILQELESGITWSQDHFSAGIFSLAVDTATGTDHVY